MAAADLDRDIKMAESPGSSDLSELASEDEDDQTSIADMSSRPSVDRDSSVHPAKRRKTGNSTLHTISYERATSSQPDADLDDILSISEDSFGSAPGSPTHDEYVIRDEAQTECLWQDCDFGRAQNNDELVQHVQSTHCASGGPKRAKYICEWGECQNKKNNVHPSNYALKAHCRSHTKEKPYYCALPECDKAFTRSDALAKHMRTVHEPELIKGVGGAPAPFLDPPSIAKKPAEPKSTISTIKSAPVPYTPVYDDNGREIDPSVPNDNITYIPAYHPSTGQPGFMIHYPPDIHFSSWESSIRADELMRYLRHQIRWAEEENKSLEEETAELEKIRREEWTLKELLLEGFIESEQHQAETLPTNKVSQSRKREILDSAAEEMAMNKRRRPVSTTVPSRRSRGGRDVIKNEPVEHSTPAQQAPALDETELDIEPELSPPPTGASGGFDGEDDPYDNYVQEMMKRYANKRDSAAGEPIDAVLQAR